MKLFSLSASKIKTYKMCPFKFYLSYHRLLDNRMSWAAENGSMVHVIFERMGEDIRDGVPRKESNIFKNWQDEVLYAYRDQGLWKLSPKAIEREKNCIGCKYNIDGQCQIAGASIDKFEGCPITEYEDALMMVEKVVNDEGITSPFNKKIIDVEDKFKLEIPDGRNTIIVNGIIDVVTELDKSTIEIIDYKTGKFVQSYNECIKDPQLLIYHLAAKRKFSTYDNFMITIMYLRKKNLTLSFGKGDEAGTEKALRHYWHTILGNESPARRCDRRDGSIKYDHICKYMCDIETCEKEYEKFQDNGRKILESSDVYPPRAQWLDRSWKYEDIDGQ